MPVTLFGNGDVGETVAIPKSIGYDAGDAVWNGDAGETVAIIKSIGSDAGDAVWDGDVGETVAILKKHCFRCWRRCLGMVMLAIP